MLKQLVLIVCFSPSGFFFRMQIRICGVMHSKQVFLSTFSNALGFDSTKIPVCGVGYILQFHGCFISNIGAAL